MQRGITTPDPACHELDTQPPIPFLWLADTGGSAIVDSRGRQKNVIFPPLTPNGAQYNTNPLCFPNGPNDPVAPFALTASPYVGYPGAYQPGIQIILCPSAFAALNANLNTKVPSTAQKNSYRFLAETVSAQVLGSMPVPTNKGISVRS